MRLRPTLIAGLSALAALGVASCGGSSSQVLVRVDGVGTVTRSSLQHWMRVEAVLTHELIPTRPAPAGVLPDPPGYSACIAYLKQAAAKLGQSPAQLTHSALKTRCSQAEHELEMGTLSKLISWYWTIGRGESLGIQVSDAQVRHRLAEVISAGTLYGKNFNRYLELTGESRADILLRSRVQAYEVQISSRALKLVSTLPKSLSESQRQDWVNALNETVVKTWRAKTTCSTGYVVSSCKQYRGSEQPLGAAT
jgi:foldase protein PrsA